MVDAADGVLEQDMADARIRSVGRSGAFFLLLLFWRWQGTRPRVRDLPWQVLLTAATGLVRSRHLSYVQLNDTYLVGMLPFALLLIGGALATRPRRARITAPPPGRSPCWWR